MTGKSEARWRAEPYPYERAVALASELGVSHTTAAVLVRRGFADGPAARSFLEGAEQHDPDLFAGIDRAVEVVMRHVAGGTPIAIHGDYDVDGVCSAAVLASALEALGASVHVRLPSRDEGYGLSVARVEELHAAGARLLITTDCGITACAEVDRAIALGMDMVVTDHHRPAATLPACPVVHPSVCGYPAELCATGVAYKFAQALYTAAGRDPAELEPQLDLVALATVADLVPLVGENRALVKQGLRAIAGTSRPGLRALLRVTAVDPQSVTEQTLGFALAPRINAAGRLYRADAALELVLTRDEDRALEIARELDAVNAERQSVETAILFEAERLLSEQGVTGSGGAADPLYVLAHQDWHPGVIGIVASRLVDRYHRPFVMVAMSESGDGRGSGRSIRPYDLHAGLAATADHLEGFGGHRMAAGLQVRAERLDDFRAALVDHARSCLSPADLVKVEHVDAVVPGDALGLDLAEELQSLRPFGMGNPAINVLVPAAKVSDVRPMGGGRHVRFSVTSGGLRSRAVGFGITPGSGALGNGGTRHDLAARLEANEWQGAVEPRLVVRSLHPVEEPEACEGARRLRVLHMQDGRRRMVERGLEFLRSGRAHTSPNSELRTPNCRGSPQQGRPRRAGRPDEHRRVAAGYLRRRLPPLRGVDSRPRRLPLRATPVDEAVGTLRRRRGARTRRTSCSPITARLPRRRRWQSGSRTCSRSIRLLRQRRTRGWSTAALDSCTWDGVRPRWSSRTPWSSTNTICGPT